MEMVVLGKNGQLGSELLRQSGNFGYTSIGHDSQELDVCDSTAFLEMIDRLKPTVVINATAFHVVPECEKNPTQAFAVNAAAVKQMTEQCRERRIQFVTYSTDYVFDGRKDSPYVEDDRPNPLQVYGVSKYAGELLVQLYNPDGIIIRTNGLYGGLKGSPMKKGNFVLARLRDSETKSELEVSCEQVVNPTYAVDLARATLQLLQKEIPGGIYHLASSGYCTWAEFAAMIMKIKKRPMKIIPVDRGGQSDASRRPLFSVLENTKAKRFGITMPKWDDAVRRYLEILP